MEIQDHIEFTNNCSTFQGYISYLKQLKKKKLFRNFQTNLTNALAIIDDLIDIDGYFENSTPRNSI